MGSELISRLPDFNRISDYIFHHAKLVPRSEAFVHNENRISYRSLADQVNCCACALIASGLRKGDRVAMLSTPRPEVFVVFLATVTIGGIWLGLNPRNTASELDQILNDAKPRILVSLVRFENTDYAGTLISLMRTNASITQLITLDGDLDGLSTNYSRLVATAGSSCIKSLNETTERVGAADPAAIIYTSGSTGVPKGVVLSHRSFIKGYRVQYAHWPAFPLRSLNNLPINHIVSIGDISVFSLIHGGAIVFMDRFHPDMMIDTIDREKITFLQQFAVQYKQMLESPRFHPQKLSSLQFIVWGGAPMPRDIVQQLSETGAQLSNSYGNTECGAPVVFTDANASVDILVDTVGRPDPFYSVRIANRNEDAVPIGESGEIQVRSDTLMRGYFNRPEDTAKAISPEGWLRTGDVGIFRPDGNLQLVGRTTDVFKSGGYSVYPREIESVLERHSAIALAAVVAVPDPLYQEVGHAFIVTKSSIRASELISWCRSQLANYKVPKRFHIVHDVPLLPNGKIDKPALRKICMGGCEAEPNEV